jgi:hypothetical protein
VGGWVVGGWVVGGWVVGGWVGVGWVGVGWVVGGWVVGGWVVGGWVVGGWVAWLGAFLPPLEGEGFKAPVSLPPRAEWGVSVLRSLARPDPLRTVLKPGSTAEHPPASHYPRT